MGEMSGGQKMAKTAHKGLLLDSSLIDVASFHSVPCLLLWLNWKASQGGKNSPNLSPKGQIWSAIPLPCLFINWLMYLLR